MCIELGLFGFSVCHSVRARARVCGDEREGGREKERGRERDERCGEGKETGVRICEVGGVPGGLLRVLLEAGATFGALCGSGLVSSSFEPRTSRLPNSHLPPSNSEVSQSLTLRPSIPKMSPNLRNTGPRLEIERPPISIHEQHFQPDFGRVQGGGRGCGGCGRGRATSGFSPAATGAARRCAGCGTRRGSGLARHWVGSETACNSRCGRRGGRGGIRNVERITR